MKEHPKVTYSKSVASGSRVLDVGCWRYTYYRFCNENGFSGFEHFGIDFQIPDLSPPDDYEFTCANVDRNLPFRDETFDAIVASHIYEHVSDGIFFMGEIFRILRPGGLLYFECPSERSLWFPSMPFLYQRNHSLNFFDDPTHIGRPISPQGLHRLFGMYGADVLKVDYIQSKISRIKFPLKLFRAILNRDPESLEAAFWDSWGFSVYAIGRKGASNKFKYTIR